MFGITPISQVGLNHELQTPEGGTRITPQQAREFMEILAAGSVANRLIEHLKDNAHRLAQ